MKLTRYANNPILKPNPENAWESLVTTNPGAWYDEEAKKVRLVYRAAGNDPEHRIFLGLAESSDGYHFHRVSDQPFFRTSDEGGWDGGSVEDARIVKFGEYYFITYAAVPTLPGQYWVNRGRFQLKNVVPEFPINLRENWTRTGLLITRDFKEVFRAGYLTDPTVDDRDVILFPEKVDGKFFVFHRPMQWIGPEFGCEHPAMWIASCDDLLEPKRLSLLAKAEYAWEVKIGGAAPPIKTEAGWFTLYHAVGPDNRYRVGAMLLDLKNPARVLARTKEPIYEPEAWYEMEGIYQGITFPCGNVVIGDTLFVYYGGADQYCGLATCNFPELVEFVRSQPVGASPQRS